MPASSPRGHSPASATRWLVRTALVVLALLALGEAAPAAFPVRVLLEADAVGAVLTLDGTSHVLGAPSRPWRSATFESPGPLEREIQVDGTDTLATLDRDAGRLRDLLPTAYYAVLAWLRDEASYSRWADVRVEDLQTGVVERPTMVAGEPVSLPGRFLLEANLRRPEARASIWLGPGEGQADEGLTLQRDRREARWGARATGDRPSPETWFFPEDPLPFAASLVHLAGRSAAAGFALFLAAGAIGLLASRLPRWRRQAATVPLGLTARVAPLRRGAGLAALAILLAGWLGAAAWVTVALYQQTPHVLDAVSYGFQATVLASGRWSWDAPPLVEAFAGPFQVVREERWFSQYPPGAPLAHAVGRLVGLTWLVGPLAGVVMLAATGDAARSLYGRRTAWAALGLGVVSPFVLFQAGSFLSHPVAGALLAVALAMALRARTFRGYTIVGLLFGAAFVTRETATLLFALPVVAWLLVTGRRSALLGLVLGGAPFLALYLAYNAALTGSPLILPRTLFDGGDRFGFGDGVGFYGRHTLAAGLANAEQQLTLLQLDLAGWPPLFSLGLLALPVLLSRPDRRDALVLSGAALFVVAYVAYFYHGIALGPRYYYEALPWLFLLGARGLQVCARRLAWLGLSPAVARAGLACVVVALFANSAVFYLPRQVERRADYTGIPYGRRLAYGFVERTLPGPRLTDLEEPALILVDDWWLYNTGLAALNCGTLDRERIATCPALLALATTSEDERRLRAEYPGRHAYRVVDRGGTLRLQPAASD